MSAKPTNPNQDWRMYGDGDEVSNRPTPLSVWQRKTPDTNGEDEVFTVISIAGSKKGSWRASIFTPRLGMTVLDSRTFPFGDYEEIDPAVFTEYKQRRILLRQKAVDALFGD